MKTMILSILHDNTLMRQENFATGLDIFTGDVDEHCPQNKCYGEIHTGEAWQPAKERFCGRDGKYMPFGIIIFGDKSHTDLHGSLSVTPIPSQRHFSIGQLGTILTVGGLLHISPTWLMEREAVGLHARKFRTSIIVLPML